MLALRDRSRRRTDDAGFTLVEVMVAIMIATIVFMALAAASISALRGTGIARQNSQATSLGNDSLESARTAAYAGLAMNPFDLSGDPRVLSGNTFSVPGVAVENLYVLPTGSLNPHITTLTRNNLPYTVATYVTVPAGTALDGDGLPLVKRVTTIVTWSAYGTTRTRTFSTLIVPTKRGLPLPDYTLALRTPSCTSWNTGSTQRPVFSFLLRNVGARDTFDVSLVSSTDSPSSWGFYLSDPSLGSATAAIDTDGNGVVDTDSVEPYSTTQVWVRRYSTLPAGTTVTFSVRAQSVAQPSASTAVVTLPATGSTPSTLSTTSVSGNVTTCAGGGATATPTPTGTSTSTATPTPTGPVADNTCPAVPAALAVFGSSGYAAKAFGLNNGDTTIDGSTTATGRNTASLSGADKTNVMVQDNCLPQTGTPDFSTNYATTGYPSGRVLVAGGTGGTSDSTDKQVEWQIAPSPAFRIGSTTHYLVMWVQCTGTSPSSATLAASLWTTKNSGYNAQVSASSGNTATVSCVTAGTWQQVSIPIPVGSATSMIPSGSVKGLALRLWETSGPALRLGYDLMANNGAQNKSYLTMQVRNS